MKAILDACCGSRMFWFDRRHPDVVFMDRREETHMLCDGRTLEIKPDVVGDFRKMPFNDGVSPCGIRPSALDSRWGIILAGQEVRKTGPENLEGGFEIRLPGVFPGFGTGRHSGVQVVRGSGFNRGSSETGQP